MTAFSVFLLIGTVVVEPELPICKDGYSPENFPAECKDAYERPSFKDDSVLWEKNQ